MSIRKKGKGYEIIISTGKDPKTGKYKQKSFMFHGSLPEARKEEARLKYEYKNQIRIDSKMTVEQYLVMWLDRTKDDRAYKTQKSYVGECNNHIIPFLGKKKLDRLTPLHIQEYYSAKQNEPKETRLSNTTINYHHRILRSALNQAVKWKLIRDNPALGAVPPSKDKFTPELLTVLQVHQVLEAMQGDPRRMSVMLSIMTGMRRGETCGLRWQDINFDLNTIQILHSMARETGRGIVMGDTKTGKGRIIPLTPYLRAELLKQQEWLKKNKEIYLDAYNNENLVVCWDDGRRMDPDQVTKKYKATLIDIGLSSKTRYHDLRHAHGTWLLEQGADMKTIQEQLGHSSISVTSDIYLNPNIETRRKQINKIDSLINSAKRKK